MCDWTLSIYMKSTIVIVNWEAYDFFFKPLGFAISMHPSKLSCDNKVKKSFTWNHFARKFINSVSVWQTFYFTFKSPVRGLYSKKNLSLQCQDQKFRQIDETLTNNARCTVRKGKLYSHGKKFLQILVRCPKWLFDNSIFWSSSAKQSKAARVSFL